MNRLTILIASLLLSAPSWAVTDEGDYVVLGHGGVSCGTYVKDYEQDSWGSTIQKAWIAGYISALNNWMPFGGANLIPSDNEGMFRWILNYCEDNPLDDLSTATMIFAAERLEHHGLNP